MVLSAAIAEQSPSSARTDFQRSVAPLRSFFSTVSSSIEWLFGALSLIVGLSILATIPLLQILSLGYLLEVSGCVAREGRIRAGFVGVRKAARVGRLALGIALWMVPLWIIASLARAAWLIDADGRAARGWQIGLWVASVFVLAHFVGACGRGGRLRDFLWPRPIRSWRALTTGNPYTRARDATCRFLLELRLPYYASLGARGFAGAAMWLLVPVSLLAIASRLPPGAGAVAGLVGGALLALMLLYLPFAQARFAQENRWEALFELRPLRALFVRAPVAFFIALVCLLTLALPLYLLKIELVPREAEWLPSLLFVVSMFPARLLSGWALARGQRRERARLWLFRWSSRLAMLPVVVLYAFLAYFTQYLSWYGVWSLYEQHAFLVPAPFLKG